MYKKISFRSVPKPGRETAPGFSLRDVRLRVERMIAQGKAHPDDRFFYVSWRR
jgi:hypothetical protein